MTTQPITQRNPQNTEILCNHSHIITDYYSAEWRVQLFDNKLFSYEEKVSFWRGLRSVEFASIFSTQQPIPRGILDKFRILSKGRLLFFLLKRSSPDDMQRTDNSRIDQTLHKRMFFTTSLVHPDWYLWSRQPLWIHLQRFRWWNFWGHNWRFDHTQCPLTGAFSFKLSSNMEITPFSVGIDTSTFEVISSNEANAEDHNHEWFRHELFVN